MILIIIILYLLIDPYCKGHTQIDRHRQTDIQSHSHTDTHSHTGTYRHRHKHKD